MQLASEVDEVTFKRRVQSLKVADMLPEGAKVADSKQGCPIFANQRNTLVLYAGPFPGKYDGCATRFGGPADAFIKGNNPDASREYISCLCPANPAALPVLKAGDRSAHVGELQRALTHANYNVGPLDQNTWGVMTPGTVDAVTRFQKDNRLRPNGQVDAATWDKLKGEQGC